MWMDVKLTAVARRVLAVGRLRHFGDNRFHSAAACWSDVAMMLMMMMLNDYTLTCSPQECTVFECSVLNFARSEMSPCAIYATVCFFVDDSVRRVCVCVSCVSLRKMMHQFGHVDAHTPLVHRHRTRTPFRSGGRCCIRPTRREICVLNIRNVWGYF